MAGGAGPQRVLGWWLMRYLIEPVPKPRMTQRDKWKKRECVLRYRKFKDLVRLRRVRLPQPCHIVFWLPMPASWKAPERAQMAGTAHQQKPDLDNLLKALLDAVHADDAHLHDIHVEKRWGYVGCIDVEAVAR